MFPTATAHRGGDLRLRMLVVALYIIVSLATVVVHILTDDNPNTSCTL